MGKIITGGLDAEGFLSIEKHFGRSTSDRGYKSTDEAFYCSALNPKLFHLSFQHESFVEIVDESRSMVPHLKPTSSLATVPCRASLRKPATAIASLR